MKLLLSLLVICLFISNIYSQTNPPTLTFSVKVYDQFPDYNNNFQAECSSSLATGLVKGNLNPDSRLPELVSLNPNSTLNKQGCMKSPELFQYFFAPQTNSTLPGYNSPLNVNLDFKYDTVRQVYVFDSQEFFPINNKGFDVDPAYRIYKNANQVYQNYHFCIKMSHKFTYKGNENFNFRGDDDVWVFINNKLVIDLGGVHGPVSRGVDTRTLGLTIGNSYNLDFFFCERQTSGSTMRIETNILFVCPFKDFCGVCEGDGSSCCNAATTCNDNNACTIDECPNGNTTLNGNPISSYCTHTPKENPNPNNVCVNYKCNTTSGNFDSTPIPCLDRSSECLSSTCDPITGCKFETVCKNVCNYENRCSNGTCVIKTPEQCGVELDGSVDLCQVYSCDPNGVGCVKEDKCKPSTDKCQIVSCDANSGNCITTPLEDPLSGVDKCTTGKCNPTTGIFEYIPITCPPPPNNCSINTGCDSAIGCQYENTCNAVCEVINECSNNGTCVIKTPEQCGVELDGSVDLCQVYSCDPNGVGCVKEDKCKPHSNPCILTQCNAENGACYDTQIPGDVCDCGCGEITNKCMKSFCTKEGTCKPKLKCEIDDGDDCTVDLCDPCTGIVTHSMAPQCLSCTTCVSN